MLTFQSQLIEEDYIKAYRSSTKTLWFLIFLSPILYFLLTNGMEWAFSSSIPNNLMLKFFIMAIVLVVIYCIYMARPDIFANRLMEKSLSSMPTTVEIDDDKIRMVTGQNENTMEWGLFDKVLETDDQFILLYSTNISCLRILPKRFFPSDVDQKYFRDLVNEKITRNPEVVIRLKQAKNDQQRTKKTSRFWFSSPSCPSCAF
jgi:hypothetical protein